MVSRSKKKNFLHFQIQNQKQGNSLNPELAKTLTDYFLEAELSSDLSGVFLSAEGKNFCTGANLSWMFAATQLSETENHKDMKILAEMYTAILSYSGPIVTKIQGKVMGGGVGIVSASDMVLADEKTEFILSETSLGLVPGIITPIVLRKIGFAKLTEYAITGKWFSAEEAQQAQLINHICKPAEIDQKADEILAQIESNSAKANRKFKKMLNAVSPISEKTLFEFAKDSADMRHSSDFINRAKKFNKDQ